MARTGLVQDERFQRHLTGPSHAERPQRLAAISRALDERGLGAQCTPIEVKPVDMELVRRNHDDAYIERLKRACDEGRPIIDVPDSAICPESFEIARLAAGAVIQAVDDVMAGKIDNAFCAVRPPGHHAERHMSMGFCLFNNVAIAARHLLEDHGLSRVLILDWDVHHGNGTQHTFEEDPRVLFISLHGHPGIVYPGTGYANERGKGPGEGYTLNFSMLPPSSDTEWQQAFQSGSEPRAPARADIRLADSQGSRPAPILDAVEDFDPQFILISAGFDAHRLDPLAPLELSTDIYGWMTDRVVEAARNHCTGRLVSLLEGGYHLGALADCTALHLTRLLHA